MYVVPRKITEANPRLCLPFYCPSRTIVTTPFLSFAETLVYQLSWVMGGDKLCDNRKPFQRNRNSSFQNPTTLHSNPQYLLATHPVRTRLHTYLYVAFWIWAEFPVRRQTDDAFECMVSIAVHTQPSSPIHWPLIAMVVVLLLLSCGVRLDALLSVIPCHSPNRMTTYGNLNGAGRRPHIPSQHPIELSQISEVYAFTTHTGSLPSTCLWWCPLLRQCIFPFLLGIYSHFNILNPRRRDKARF